MSAEHAVVVGAGLAGLTAAIDLMEAGRRVTVLEQASVVGGRTADWEEAGMRVESGLHRYLGFYVELPRLIRRAGLRLEDIVVWQDEIEIRTPGPGPAATFAVSMVHRPVETIATALGNDDFLPIGQKLALGRMLAAGVSRYLTKPDELDRTTVAELAREHGVSETTLFRILRPLTEGLFFVPPEEYSAYPFLGLIVPYWKSAVATRVGSFAGGMTEVLAGPLAEYIRGGGGIVRTATPVESIATESGCVVGVRTADGEEHPGEVVLATGIGPAQRMLRETFGHAEWCAGLLELLSTPSVSMQFELREPCLPLDRATFGPGTVLASFSEQSRSTFTESTGRLSVILASPGAHLGRPAEELARLVVADAAKLGIELEGQIIDQRKVVFPMDFYSLRPGSEALRPPQRTPVPGLALAGDYTAQPYLTTMEGAVESGARAARAILEGA